MNEYTSLTPPIQSDIVLFYKKTLYTSSILMAFLTRKYFPLWGLAFFFVFIAAFFFISKEQYLLNKVVRHTDMRLFQFQRLSDKLNESFKFHFSNDSLTIYNYEREKEEWKVYLDYSFPVDISCDLNNFEVNFHDGVLTSLNLEGMEKIRQSYIILFFYSKENKESNKGIIFYRETGEWRVLK